MTTSTPTTDSPTRSDDASWADEVGHAVSDAASTVQAFAESRAAQAQQMAPEIAAATLTMIEDATGQLRTGSDDMLAVGSAMSFGFAAGLLTLGAPRLIVAGALVPSALMAFTLYSRARTRRGSWLGRGHHAG